jgi:hypothetical protein
MQTSPRGPHRRGSVVAKGSGQRAAAAKPAHQPERSKQTAQPDGRPTSERNGPEPSRKPRHARRRGGNANARRGNGQDKVQTKAQAKPAREQLLPLSVKLSGDTLALDRTIRSTIEEQATQLRSRFPSQAIDMTARIAAEFDQLNGHRVRFELIASLADRQQIIVREARKSAEEAMASAFRGLKGKLRQVSLRACMPGPAAGRTLQAAAT